MAKTVGDTITEARVILNDSAGARYTDVQLVAAFNNAISEAKSLRPDMFVFGEALPQYTTADFGQPFPLPQIVFQSFVYFLAGDAELRDDEFAVDGRAMTLLGAFKQKLTS